jgi:hypothetical protein
LRRRREEANLRKLKEQEEADAAAEVAEAAEKAAASEVTEVRVEIMRRSERRFSAMGRYLRLRPSPHVI